MSRVLIETELGAVINGESPCRGKKIYSVLQDLAFFFFFQFPKEKRPMQSLVSSELLHVFIPTHPPSAPSPN